MDKLERSELKECPFMKPRQSHMRVESMHRQAQYCCPFPRRWYRMLCLCSLAVIALVPAASARHTTKVKASESGGPWEGSQCGFLPLVWAWNGMTI